MDPDPDPAFHSYAETDLDPDPTSQNKAECGSGSRSVTLFFNSRSQMLNLAAQKTLRHRYEIFRKSLHCFFRTSRRKLATFIDVIMQENARKTGRMSWNL